MFDYQLTNTSLLQHGWLLSICNFTLNPILFEANNLRKHIYNVQNIKAYNNKTSKR